MKGKVFFTPGEVTPMKGKVFLVAAVTAAIALAILGLAL